MSKATKIADALLDGKISPDDILDKYMSSLLKGLKGPKGPRTSRGKKRAR